ncbi:MAG: hypothetical protein EXS39_07180 [Opitutaceae bacterium]|nr:hypothetical protein [Opitutaceae bacterium]
MKTYAAPKPFGTATSEPIVRVRYLDKRDVFEVEFSSGEIYVIKHAAILKANGLVAGTGEVDSVWIEGEMRSGFLVRYTNGEMADCAWDFVKESPLKK